MLKLILKKYISHQNDWHTLFIKKHPAIVGFEKI